MRAGPLAGQMVVHWVGLSVGSMADPLVLHLVDWMAGTWAEHWVAPRAVMWAAPRADWWVLQRVGNSAVRLAGLKAAH